jgi:DnaJ-domain-containing protein 1
MLSALRTLTAPRRLTCASQLPREALLRAFAAEPQPPSHYEVLGLQNSATAEEIKSAFRRVRNSRHQASTSMHAVVLVV